MVMFFLTIVIQGVKSITLLVSVVDACAAVPGGESQRLNCANSIRLPAGSWNMTQRESASSSTPHGSST